MAGALRYADCCFLSGMKTVHTVCVVSGSGLKPRHYTLTPDVPHPPTPPQISKMKLAGTFVLNDLQVRQAQIQTSSSWSSWNSDTDKTKVQPLDLSQLYCKNNSENQS